MAIQVYMCISFFIRLLVDSLLVDPLLGSFCHCEECIADSQIHSAHPYPSPFGWPAAMQKRAPALLSQIH